MSPVYASTGPVGLGHLHCDGAVPGADAERSDATARGRRLLLKEQRMAFPKSRVSLTWKTRVKCQGEVCPLPFETAVTRRLSSYFPVIFGTAKVELTVAQKSGDTPRPAGRILRLRPTDSQDETADSNKSVTYNGKDYYPPKGRHWSVTSE